MNRSEKITARLFAAERAHQYGTDGASFQPHRIWQHGRLILPMPETPRAREQRLAMPSLDLLALRPGDILRLYFTDQQQPVHLKVTHLPLMNGLQPQDIYLRPLRAELVAYDGSAETPKLGPEAPLAVGDILYLIGSYGDAEDYFQIREATSLIIRIVKSEMTLLTDFVESITVLRPNEENRLQPIDPMNALWSEREPDQLLRREEQIFNHWHSLFLSIFSTVHEFNADQKNQTPLLINGNWQLRVNNSPLQFAIGYNHVHDHYEPVLTYEDVEAKRVYYIEALTLEGSERVVFHITARSTDVTDHSLPPGEHVFGWNISNEPALNETGFYQRITNSLRHDTKVNYSAGRTSYVNARGTVVKRSPTEATVEHGMWQITLPDGSQLHHPLDLGAELAVFLNEASTKGCSLILTDAPKNAGHKRGKRGNQ